MIEGLAITAIGITAISAYFTTQLEDNIKKYFFLWVTLILLPLNASIIINSLPDTASQELITNLNTLYSVLTWVLILGSAYNLYQLMLYLYNKFTKSANTDRLKTEDLDLGGI